MENNRVDTEIAKRLFELRKQRFQLKMAFWQGENVGTANFKKIKKEIARLKTAEQKKAND